METWICSVPPSTTTSIVCRYVFAGVFLRRAADMFVHVATLDFVPQLFTPSALRDPTVGAAFLLFITAQLMGTQ